jgi:hypothetical protein
VGASACRSPNLSRFVGEALPEEALLFDRIVGELARRRSDREIYLQKITTPEDHFLIFMTTLIA